MYRSSVELTSHDDLFDGTHAVVAAKISIFRGLVRAAKVIEKHTVNPIAAKSLANGSLTRYNASTEIAGSKDESATLIVVAMVAITESS